MIVAVLRGNKINRLILPDLVEGNYIIKDYQHHVIGNLYAQEGAWLLDTNRGYYVEGINEGESLKVTINNQIIIKDKQNDEYLYVYIYKPNEVPCFLKRIKSTNISIGQSADISYESNVLNKDHAKISLVNNLWYIESLNNAAVYVNDRLIRRKRLEHGDIIFIYGLKIVIIGENILIQNFNSLAQLNVKDSVFEECASIAQPLNEGLLTVEGDYEMYNEDNQFMRSPRFRSTIKHETVSITPPPQKQEEQTKPGILTIGPRLTMMLTSVIGLLTTLGNIATGQATLKSSMLSIITTVIMLVSSLLWPFLTNKWDKHAKRKAELKRIKLYRAYLKKKDKEISNICELQKQILLENNITLEDCQLIIYNKKRNLWEKIISDDDFLTVRLGIGKVKPDIEISWKEEEFEIEDDNLKDDLKDMLKKYDYMDNLPLNVSLVKNNRIAFIGNYALLYSFMQSILLQIMTFHMYSELKIAIFTDEDKVADWNYLKFLPHVWDNQHERRLIASTMEEKKQLSNYLESIFYERSQAEGEDAYKNFSTYYLIIVDNINETRNLGIIKDVLEMENNTGFTILIKNDRIANLPRQCTTFVNVTEDVSGVFETDLTDENQKQFKADFNRTVNIEDCVQKIANIYVEVPKEKYELPKSIGFMEMYEVGNVEQFNSRLRWKGNNPVISLAVPVGIDQNGNTFYMDIHEKAFGPHGLVAGTTGSGKSEWLITFILSLSVNFSPLEVQFVLIDYKGGGLAESFTNQETGMELPHLVGTITNLDKSEISRSLASLESESKRRQRLFNEARDKLDDSSMDIYKYQQYYRKGLVDEPLSHLIIISDEFAELKSQEPEFLDSLVSIARIGRSLGIHLILATQKPSGVVTDQIWANSRFKVCLRVQEKNDSKDMIETNDAAYLKQTGAFYLEVGNQEVYALGQSAYSGLKYQPTNIVKKKIDTAVDKLDKNGDIINTYEIVETKEIQNVHGEELLNIIKYLDSTAEEQNIVARKLWLTAIPNLIYIENLKKKYKFVRTPFDVNPIIGEYDDPIRQRQSDLKLRLNESNVFITGVAGSGKEMMLQTIIYSTITSYTPQEINLYICDFGAETLLMFENAPHVGDVILTSDVSKMENLVKVISKEYSSRRVKYRDFGGNYENYNKYNQQKDPLITVVINGYEFLKDEMFSYVDFLDKIMMDSFKYGIIFILSSVDKNSIRYKLLSTFTSVFVLHMNDDTIYYEILGKKARNMVPKDCKGRGIFADDYAYEFQTASICEEENLLTQVKSVCTRLNEYYKAKAKPIPIIPNPITLDYINKDKINIKNLVVGYSKRTLDQITIDAENNVYTLITSNKKKFYLDFSSLLYQQIDFIKQDNMYLFDAVGNLKNITFNNIKYFEKENCKTKLFELLDVISKEYNDYKALVDKTTYVPKKMVWIFDVISVLLLNLNEEEKRLFSEGLAKAEKMKCLTVIYGDILSEVKNNIKEDAIALMITNNNMILLDNTIDTQSFAEIASRDIKTRDLILENEGYIVKKGKATFAQVLRSEKIGGEENEI